MRRGVIAMLLLGAALAHAAPALSQAQRLGVDAIWARSTDGAPITLDGVLDEPAWALADSIVIWYGKDNGIPGSGYLENGGKLSRDSTHATLRFLVVGNQLYMGAVVPDSSIGGSKDYNRFDGFLMSFKDHLSSTRPAPPVEYLYSWWYPQIDSCAGGNSLAVGLPPDFRGRYGNRPKCTDRTPEMIAAWDARTVVHGISNSDTLVDHDYTVEMRFDLAPIGYDVTKTEGDVVEFGIQVYDNDWYWPQNLLRWSSTRTWWQSPWGLDAWYDQVQIHARPDVTIHSGPPSAVGPDFRIRNGATWATPVVDGLLNEPVWSAADSIHLKYDDTALRDSYPGVIKWRSGQDQPNVNGSQATVFDPGDATVKMFFKADTLYLGFDVRDIAVQYYPLIDRYDGFVVSINDRVARWRDRNLDSRRLTFQVDTSSAHCKVLDYLATLRDTLHAAKFALALKPGTTVDTTGLDEDTGYTAEMAVDLTKLGYPTGRGDGTLYMGVLLMDGDSFTPSSLSYAERTWWGRRWEHECCPVWVYMDPNTPVTGVPETSPQVVARFAVLGSYPNPTHGVAMIRYALPVTSDVRLEVFDVQGRLVASRPLGVQPAGTQQCAFTHPGLGSGLYLVRLRATDPATGTVRGTAAGKVMVMR